VFLSPERKIFTSWRAVIAQLEADPATYTPADVAKVRRALLKRRRKARSSWVPLRRRRRSRAQKKASPEAATEGQLLSIAGVKEKEDKGLNYMECDIDCDSKAAGEAVNSCSEDASTQLSGQTPAALAAAVADEEKRSGEISVAENSLTIQIGEAATVVLNRDLSARRRMTVVAAAVSGIASAAELSPATMESEDTGFLNELRPPGCDVVVVGPVKDLIRADDDTRPMREMRFVSCPSDVVDEMVAELEFSQN
jgi:hypothetical protein